MYLLDSNILLEVLLKQEKSDEVKKFLMHSEQNKLFVTDFSLYSIGILLTKRKKEDDFVKLVNDLFIVGSVSILSLIPSELIDAISNSRAYLLDFDDAYQLTCALKNNLTLVSFDKHFDNSPIKSKEPAELIV